MRPRPIASENPVTSVVPEAESKDGEVVNDFVGQGRRRVRLKADGVSNNRCFGEPVHPGFEEQFSASNRRGKKS